MHLDIAGVYGQIECQHVLPRLRRLRIAELAAEIRAPLHFCAEDAHSTKIGFVVDHHVGVPRHSDGNLSNINMRPVGRITSYRELAEIDRKLAEILGIAGGRQLSQVCVDVC